MHKKISEISLRSGEIMEIHKVRAPDRHYEHNIVSFLSYSNELWMWHLNLAMRGELDELESLFYLGLLNGRIISNVSTWQYGSIGVIAHLFTSKDYRRQGACTALMKAQIQDFRNHGGKLLIGGFRPSSYPIAESLGFKSIVDHSEVMHCILHPDFEKEYFQAKNISCKDIMWKDWPGVSLLFGVKEGWHLRSMKHKIFGCFDYEDYFLQDMSERLRGLCISKVLATEKGSIMGYATLSYKHILRGSFRLLDFFVHPVSVSYVNNLLDALDFPGSKTRCYVDSGSPEKLNILLKRGFKEKTLQKQIKHNGKALDIIAMEI